MKNIIDDHRLTNQSCGTDKPTNEDSRLIPVKYLKCLLIWAHVTTCVVCSLFYTHAFFDRCSSYVSNGHHRQSNRIEGNNHFRLILGIRLNTFILKMFAYFLPVAIAFDLARWTSGSNASRFDPRMIAWSTVVMVLVVSDIDDTGRPSVGSGLCL